ncbi:MAG: nicotinate-nucleotide--dimethylbenzimidazole phosphoribosyltransferase [Oceanospirillaceae bacterium]|nr:nicotinate-nucleotide--dimethylbenzimidazole phosphoribosyltransferase [Oceanospirillaceae bacterium]MBT5630270.1 nicotinate-nucleotide--dimethylbenzimidazole phosphoribosyltransferase [Oceanospirillaceae bacterium]
MTIDWIFQPLAALNANAREQGLERQGQLTKPPGSLGLLETMAVRLCAMQGVDKPNVDHAQVVVFAGDHGIAAEGVSAFPQVVTGEMVKNFSRGGAAICALARQNNAQFEVVNVGTVVDLPSMNDVLDSSIMPGTSNFAQQPAMTLDQLSQAMTAGMAAADRAAANQVTLFIGGEMGIANTSSATALAAWATGQSVARLVGPGTGLDLQGISHKAQVIESALAKHASAMISPVEALRHIGGLEIAALVGAYIRLGQLGIAILVDGFITTSAAIVAAKIHPQILDWMFFAHASAEPGHQTMMTSLGAKAMLDLDMRLGEGSGAGVALSILKSACVTHNEMATFAEASVSEKSA